VSEGLALCWSDRVAGVCDESGSDRICDATVPISNPVPLLAVYDLSGRTALVAVSAIQPSDGDRGLPLPSTRFALREAANEPVFGFYPSRDGRYLCWENHASCKACRASCRTNRSKQTGELRPSGRHVALVIDGRRPGLTCVDLTYQGRQIE